MLASSADALLTHPVNLAGLLGDGGRRVGRALRDTLHDDFELLRVEALALHIDHTLVHAEECGSKECDRDEGHTRRALLSGRHLCGLCHLLRLGLGRRRLLLHRLGLLLHWRRWRWRSSPSRRGRRWLLPLRWGRRRRGVLIEKRRGGQGPDGSGSLTGGAIEHSAEGEQGGEI